MSLVHEAACGSQKRSIAVLDVNNSSAPVPQRTLVIGFCRVRCRIRPGRCQSSSPKHGGICSAIRMRSSVSRALKELRSTRCGTAVYLETVQRWAPNSFWKHWKASRPNDVLPIPMPPFKSCRLVFGLVSRISSPITLCLMACLPNMHDGPDRMRTSGRRKH